MNYNNFKDSFLNNRTYPPTSSVIIDTNIIRNYEDLDYICYVEGPTDEDFYGNIKNLSISNKKIKFITGLTKNDEIKEYRVGKESVIKKYYEINSYVNFKYLLKKSIFIIDSDNYGLLSEYYDEKYLNKKVFNITNGYAFENYFFSKRNIRKIFEYFKLTETDLNEFVICLNRFIKEVSYYNRLKCSTTIACKKCKYHTYLPSTRVEFLYGKKAGKKITAEDIFDFDFTGKYNYYFRKNLMERQNKKIKEVIGKNDLIMDYFNNVSIKFENNANYIRGHDIYNFLQKYLYQKFNINISPRITENSKYFEVLKIIDVDINFVNGLGEDIKY